MALTGFQIPYPDLSVVLGGGGPAPVASANAPAAVVGGKPAELRVTELRETDGQFGYVADMLVVDDVVVMVGGRSYDATFLMSSDLKHWVKREGLDNGRRAIRPFQGRLFEVGENGTFASTADLGKTWETHSSGTDQCLFSLVEHDGALWTSGDEGYFGKYTGGEAVEQIALGTDARLLDLSVVGSSLYVLGFDGHIRVVDPAAGTIVHDIELGETPLCRMLQTRSGALVVCGDGGHVWRSDDGKTFTAMEVEVPSDNDLEAIETLPDGRLCIVGADGLILLSADDGWTWNAIDGLDDSVHLWSILPLGAATLIGGDDGALWKLAPKGDKTWADKANQFEGDEDAVESDADDDDDDGDCTVMLNVTGDNKIAVIKIVREVTGLGLKESLDLVQAAPKQVKTGLSREAAERIITQLQEVGATAEIT